MRFSTGNGRFPAAVKRIPRKDGVQQLHGWPTVYARLSVHQRRGFEYRARCTESWCLKNRTAYRCPVKTTRSKTVLRTVLRIEKSNNNLYVWKNSSTVTVLQAWTVRVAQIRKYLKKLSPEEKNVPTGNRLYSRISAVRLQSRFRGFGICYAFNFTSKFDGGNPIIFSVNQCVEQNTILCPVECHTRNVCR